jgi:plasmid stabilization system protein ParE
MAHQIIWSEKTEVAVGFANTFYKKLDLINQQPFAGRVSYENPAIRRLVITRHTLLFYEVADEQIILLHNLVDSRSNPTDNSFA